MGRRGNCNAAPQHRRQRPVTRVEKVRLLFVNTAGISHWKHSSDVALAITVADMVKKKHYTGSGPEYGNGASNAMIIEWICIAHCAW